MKDIQKVPKFEFYVGYLCINLSLRLVSFSTLFPIFLYKVWMHATLLIILWFFSSFCREFVRCLSFLEKKTQNYYLYYSPFYIYLCTVVKICAKKVQNVVCIVKKRIFIFLIFFKGVRYRKNSNRFEFLRMTYLSTVKIA